MGIFDQKEFEIRCERGLEGVQKLAPISDVVIIVDILSFSTCVDIGVARGAILFPYHLKDDSAISYAASIGAELAGSRCGGHKYSLSPKSLSEIGSGEKLVLPSPNGSTLSLETMQTLTLAGCLRNASSVAQVASRLGKQIAVIPAGELWKSTGTLRPALEDLIGAGAIIHAICGQRSPESELARAAFLSVKDRLLSTILACSSGKELVAKDFGEDIKLACLMDVSTTVPILQNGAFVRCSKEVAFL